MSDSNSARAQASGQITTRAIVWRLVLSFVSVMLYGWINGLLNPVSTLLSAEIAGKQFDNSDASYIISQYGMNFFSSFGVPVIVLLVILAVIWWKPATNLLKNGLPLVMLVVVGITLLLGTTDSRAFFEKTDRTENIPIPPNWSAFWIPDKGANKDTQVQMDSEAYYQANKVPFRSFKIPHAVIKDSSGTSMWSGYDYFGPTGRLFLVDRSRFSREWVDEKDRGTSTKKEGIHCQSKGDEKYPTGINITIGVSVAAYVKDQNAAKFLYNFGIKTPVGPDGKPIVIVGDKEHLDQDGKVIYQSVFYGRSLVEVMDDVGRMRIGTLFCGEIAQRTFDNANNNMMPILAKVTTEANTYFDSVGITMDFLGYHDTWTFDKPIQEALNRRYAAIQDEQSAKLLQPYAETIKILAAAGAMRDFGAKTDGKLPTTFFGSPPEIINQLVQGAAAGAKISPVVPAK